MNANKVTLLLAAGLAVSLSACLVDEQHVVGTTGTGGMKGQAGEFGGSGGWGSGGQSSWGTGGVPMGLSIPSEEAVSRLVQVLWNTDADPNFVRQHAPDLINRPDVSTLAAQMLQDPMAVPAVGAFYRWWLDLDRIPDLSKDAVLFPEWNVALAADMAAEPETFGVNVTLNMNGTLATLLTAPFSYVNNRLAPIYGLGGNFGSKLEFAMLNAAQRGGILTQPGLQAQSSSATHNSPSVRGMNVVNRLLCLSIPAPPADVPRNINSDELANSGQTLREWLVEHRSNPACAACHAYMDPIGFAFEGFDPIGRARTTDNGLPIDLTGALTVEPMQPFDGPVQLGARLASSRQVQECMVRQWMSFMLGRSLNERDESSVAEARAAFAGSGFKLRTIISAVAGTEAFLAR